MRTLVVKSCCCGETQKPKFSAQVGDILLVVNGSGLEEVVLDELGDGDRVLVSSLHDEKRKWEVRSSDVRALIIPD